MKESQGQNRTGEIPPSGIVGGACGNVAIIGSRTEGHREIDGITTVPYVSAETNLLFFSRSERASSSALVFF